MSQLAKNFKYLAVGILFFEFAFYQFYYWNYYANESWRWWHYGYKESMTYVSENHDAYNKTIIDNTYEPSLIRYLFWSKTDPKLVFDLDDDLRNDIDGFRGYCNVNQTCFVDFGPKFKLEQLKTNNLYLISQEKNLGGDWDLRIDTPANLEILKTVVNPINKPIFYILRVR
jgi:hypothetical protein